MLLARRTAQTIFGGWCGGMAIKLLDWIVPLHDTLAAVLAAAATVAGGVIAWVASRETPPWTPEDLRDGAIGWAIVGGPLALLIAVAFLSGPWLVAACIAIVLATSAIAILLYRRADQLGVEPADRAT